MCVVSCGSSAYIYRVRDVALMHHIISVHDHLFRVCSQEVGRWTDPHGPRMCIAMPIASCHSCSTNMCPYNDICTQMTSCVFSESTSITFCKHGVSLNRASVHSRRLTVVSGYRLSLVTFAMISWGCLVVHVFAQCHESIGG